MAFGIKNFALTSIFHDDYAYFFWSLLNVFLIKKVEKCKILFFKNNHLKESFSNKIFNFFCFGAC